jgi:hypothetical protein
VHYSPQFGHSRLFQLLPKEKTRPRLNVSYGPSSDGSVLRFSAANALGVPEQTLLLVLLELAKEQFAIAPSRVVIAGSSTSEVDQLLWTKLTKANDGAGSETLRFTTTWYELNKRCGAQTGGSALKVRTQQLERLCEVVVWEMAGDTANTKRQSFLVALVVGDDKRLHIALNARLALALMGGSYAQVSLAERLSLGTDVSMAVHAFLSTAIAPGNHLRIGVETLVARFWSESTTQPAGTRRRHRFEIRDALKAIGRLDGWSVEWESEVLTRVSRIENGVRDMTRNNANKTTSYRERAFAKTTSKNNELDEFDVSGLFFNRNTSA